MPKINRRSLAATCGVAALLALAAPARAADITIATVNNGDMVVMQRLASDFEQKHPDIHLKWVVLEENVLRQRLTTDIATKAGQFDVLTVGNYEVPIWAKQGWIVPMDNLPAAYDVDDLLKPVRTALTVDGKLYALPFYAESAMTYYRKDLFDKAGIKMPDAPTYAEIRGFADKITDKSTQTYGMCLRGKPGWGENMAYVTSLVNAEGGRWFDMDWKPTLDATPWKTALDYYDGILKADGPPGRRLEWLQREPRPLRVRPLRHVDRRHRRRRHAVRRKAVASRRQGRLCPHADRFVQRRPHLALVLEPRDTRHFQAAGGGPRLPSPGRRRRTTSSSLPKITAGSPSPRHPPIHLRRCRLQESRPVRVLRPQGHRRRQPERPDRAAAPLYRRPVRRHSGVPGHRHPGRPDRRRHPDRAANGRQRPQGRRFRYRPHHETGRLPQEVA